MKPRTTMAQAFIKAGLASAEPAPVKQKLRPYFHEELTPPPEAPPFEPPPKHRASEVRSAPPALHEPIRERPEPNEEPEKYVGEMVWLKKDVSVLQIKGKPNVISPEEMAKCRRR